MSRKPNSEAEGICMSWPVPVHKPVQLSSFSQSNTKPQQVESVLDALGIGQLGFPIKFN